MSNFTKEGREETESPGDSFENTTVADVGVLLRLAEKNSDVSAVLEEYRRNSADVANVAIGDNNFDTADAASGYGNHARAVKSKLAILGFEVELGVIEASL